MTDPALTAKRSVAKWAREHAAMAQQLEAAAREHRKLARGMAGIAANTRENLFKGAGPDPFHKDFKTFHRIVNERWLEKRRERRLLQGLPPEERTTSFHRQRRRPRSAAATSGGPNARRRRSSAAVRVVEVVRQQRTEHMTASHGPGGVRATTETTTTTMRSLSAVRALESQRGPGNNSYRWPSGDHRKSAVSLASIHRDGLAPHTKPWESIFPARRRESTAEHHGDGVGTLHRATSAPSLRQHPTRSRPRSAAAPRAEALDLNYGPEADEVLQRMRSDARARRWLQQTHEGRLHELMLRPGVHTKELDDSDDEPPPAHAAGTQTFTAEKEEVITPRDLELPDWVASDPQHRLVVAQPRMSSPQPMPSPIHRKASATSVSGIGTSANAGSHHAGLLSGVTIDDEEGELVGDVSVHVTDGVNARAVAPAAIVDTKGMLRARTARHRSPKSKPRRGKGLKLGKGGRRTNRATVAREEPTTVAELTKLHPDIAPEDAIVTPSRFRPPNRAQLVEMNVSKYSNRLFAQHMSDVGNSSQAVKQAQAAARTARLQARRKGYYPDDVMRGYHHQPLSQFDQSLRDGVVRPDPAAPPMLAAAPFPLLPHQHGVVRVQTMDEMEAFKVELNQRQLQVLRQAQAQEVVMGSTSQHLVHGAAEATPDDEIGGGDDATAAVEDPTAGGFIYSDDDDNDSAKGGDGAAGGSDGHSSDGAGEIVARAIAKQQHNAENNLSFVPVRVASSIGWVTSWKLVPPWERERLAMEKADAESRLPPAPPPLPRGMSIRDDDEGGAGWVGHDGDMPDDKAWVWNSATAMFELKWKWEALLPEKPRDRPSWADATSPLPEGDEQVHSDQHDQHDAAAEPTDGPSTLAQPPSPVAINSGENDQHVTTVEPTEQRSTVAQPVSPATSSSAGGEHVATADVTTAVSVKHPSGERTAGGDAMGSVPGENDASDAGAVDDAPCDGDDDAVVGPATSSSSSHGDHEGMRSASVTSMDNASPPHDAPDTASPSTPPMPVDGGAAGVDAQHVEQLASLHLVRADTPPSLNEPPQSSQSPLDELDQHAGNHDALQAAAQPDEPTVAAPQPTPLPDVSHEAEAGNTDVSLVVGASPAHNDSCEPGDAVVASSGRPATMTSDNMMSPCADADTHNGRLPDHDDNTTASVTAHNRGEEPRHTSDSSANDESDGSDSHSGSDRSSDEGAQDDKQPGKKAPTKSKKAAKRKTSKTNKQKRPRRSSGKLRRRKGKLSGSGTTGKPSAGLADTVKSVKQGRRRRGKAREARLRTDGPGDGKRTSEGGKPKPHSRRGSKATPKPSTRRRSSSKSSATRRRKSSARKSVTAGTAGHESAPSTLDAGDEPQLGVPPLTNGVVVQFMPLGKEGRLRAAEERRRQARRARWEQEVQERMAKLEGLAGDDLAYALVKSSHNVTGASLQRRITRGKRVVPKLQAIFRGQRVRSALVRLHFNAVVIQCAFRQWVARWTRYHLRLIRAIIILQAHVRRRIAVRKWLQQFHGMVLLQARWRGYVDRSMVALWRYSAGRIVRWYRAARLRHAFRVVVRHAVVLDERETAARRIQKLTRGYFQRRWMAWVLSCAVTVQRAARSHLKYRRLQWTMAVRLQAIVRGFQRRKLNRYTAAAVVVQTHFRRLMAKWHIRAKTRLALQEATQFEAERRAAEEASVEAASEAAFEEMNGFFAGKVMMVVASHHSGVPSPRASSGHAEDAPGDKPNSDGDDSKGEDSGAGADESKGSEAKDSSTGGGASASMLDGPAKAVNTKAAAGKALMVGAEAMSLAIRSRVDDLVGQQRNVLSRKEDIIMTDLSLSAKQRQRRIAVMKLVAGEDNYKGQGDYTKEMVEEAKALAEVMQQRATVTAVFESCDTERVGLLDSEQVAAALKLLRIHTSRVRLRLAVRKVKDPPPDRLFDILSPFPSHLNLQELVAVLRHVDPQGNWGSVDVTGDYAQLVGGIAMRSMAEGGGHKGVGAERLAAIEAKRRAKLEEDEAARAARHAKGDVSDSSEYDVSTDSDWSLEDSEDEESHKRRKALMKAKWEARQRAEEAAKEQEAKRARMRTPVGRLKAKLGDVVDRAKAAKDAGQRRMRTIRRTLMGTKLKPDKAVLKIVRRKLVLDAVQEARLKARQEFRASAAGKPRYVCGECTRCFGMLRLLEKHKAETSCDPAEVRAMLGLPPFDPGPLV